MPDFSSMFIDSRGAPIQYGGKTLIMADTIPATLGETFAVTIESTRSRYPQGVGMQEGVQVFGERVRRAVVWEYFSVPLNRRAFERSRLPFRFEVECRNKQGVLRFYNMTEYDGRQEHWNRGACMIAEDIPGGRRYHCNDFDPDEDFDDMVFSVVRAGGG
jgi:hypothetical protein